MFGTIFRMRPQPGQEQVVEELFQRWAQERRSKATGFVDGYLLTSRSQPGEIVAIAIFDSETNFRKNADDPEQDRWYHDLRVAWRPIRNGTTARSSP